VLYCLVSEFGDVTVKFSDANETGSETGVRHQQQHQQQPASKLSMHDANIVTSKLYTGWFRK